MRIIAIVNQKGGSGKTTTSVNLAATLAQQGKKVLLIDLDPQGSASLWFGHKDQGKGLFELFTAEKSLQEVVVKSKWEFLDLVPSSTVLSGLEKALANEVGSETILKEKLKHSGDQWDFVLFDCPPTLGILSLNALSAAQEVLIPVETHVMALHGLVQLLRTINLVKTRLNPLLKISGILPCRVDGRTKHSTEILAQLKDRFKDQLCKCFIRENVKLAEAPLHVKPIIYYEPNCHGSTDYKSLALEIIDQRKEVV